MRKPCVAEGKRGKSRKIQSRHTLYEEIGCVARVMGITTEGDTTEGDTMGGDMGITVEDNLGGGNL